MIKRIIFLVRPTFNLRDYKRFGIKLLEQNGFKVEVWDVTPILYPDIYKKHIPSDAYVYDGLKVFHSKPLFLSRLKGLNKSDFVINIVEYMPRSLWIYRALSISEADYAVLMAISLSTTGINESKLSIYLKKLKRAFPPTVGKIIRILFPKIPFQWFGIKPAKLIFAGGDKCFMLSNPIDSNSEVIWAHTLDYDLYLQERDIPSGSSNMAVFLDEYIPFHFDHSTRGTESPVSADKYYPVLNNFFDLVEKQLGIEVVIAEHPRSDYEKLPDYFNKRKRIKGETARLVKESRFVMTHDSTSVNFANLFKKPVVFLTSSVLANVCDGTIVIGEMAEWFGKRPIFIDSGNKVDWDFELTVSDSHYRNYKQAFIKRDNTDELPFWQIVANKLKSQ